jgi:lipoyl(octanoyl) transferase
VPSRPARALWLGRRAYEPAHALQKELVEARARGDVSDVVLLLEHEPVVTLGRGANPENVVATERELADEGASVVETGRGGDVTYHGPGQLVAYPIIDLKPDRQDVRRYVRGLAEVMILLARDQGVEAGVVDGMIGVWADAAKATEWAGAEWATDIKKLGAIGVRISRWVTMHGFALNLGVDMRHFGWIVACGIKDHGVTSVAELTRRPPPAVRDVAFASARAFDAGLGASFSRVEDLGDTADAALFDAIRFFDGRAE